VAATGVLFPAIARNLSTSENEAWTVYRKTLWVISWLLLPIVIATILFIEPILALWLGVEFAQNSTLVAQVLVVGVLINSFGLVAQSFVQSSGHPNWSAKLHLIELPMYFAYLYLLILAWGICGAAVAWLLRVSISAGALMILARLAWLRRS
jgi:O-antigen/teichoic acid export membrane protein